MRPHHIFFNNFICLSLRTANVCIWCGCGCSRAIGLIRNIIKTVVHTTQYSIYVYRMDVRPKHTHINTHTYVDTRFERGKWSFGEQSKSFHRRFNFFMQVNIWEIGCESSEKKIIVTHLNIK